MPPVIDQRMTAQIEGDFVVFLIGLRINKFWRVHKWLPAAFAMPRMLKELSALPAEDTGFLGYQGGGSSITVQYWRSFDHLEAYARAPDNAHFPAWAAFNKRVKSSREDVGIWHETYLVKAGQYETLYSACRRSDWAAPVCWSPRRVSAKTREPAYLEAIRFDMKHKRENECSVFK